MKGLMLISIFVLLISCGKEVSCEGGCGFRSVTSTPPPLTLKVFVTCVGNSLTYGVGVTQDSSYPSQLGYELVDSGINSMVINRGLADRCTIDTLISLIPDFQIGQLNVVVVGETEQYMFGELYSTSVYMTGLKTYCALLRNQEFKIIVTTVPFRDNYIYDRNRIPDPSGFLVYEKDLPELNDSLRAEWSTFADGLADIEANHMFSSFPGYISPIYYQSDYINLTAAGYKIVSGIVFNSLKQIK